jgi:hypothetical protein
MPHAQETTCLEQLLDAARPTELVARMDFNAPTERVNMTTAELLVLPILDALLDLCAT